MAKNLTINCTSCDMRKAQEENYTQYEHITIDAAVVLTNEQGKAFLSRLPVTLNCSEMVETEQNVQTRCINGFCEIRSGDALPQEPFFLIVNGALTIGQDTQAYLEKCVGMTVNGSVLYPRSMSAFLGKMKVNGTAATYPDGAIVLKRSAVIDKLFTLRAKPSLYWSARRIIMVDPELDCDQLRQKGATFSSKEVIIAQSKVEQLVDLIDESTEITIVPDGTAVVLDDVTLDQDTLRRHGGKLYVSGDAVVPAQGDCLASLEYLWVKGDVKVPESRKDALMDALTKLDGQMCVMQARGMEIAEKSYAPVSKWILEQQPDGVEVHDCAVVAVADDIPREWIIQRLSIHDCGIVRCCRELEDAVSMICQEVGKIGSGATEAFGGTCGSDPDESDTRVINAASYVL